MYLLNVNINLFRLTNQVNSAGESSNFFEDFLGILEI